MYEVNSYKIYSFFRSKIHDINRRSVQKTYNGGRKKRIAGRFIPVWNGWDSRDVNFNLTGDFTILVL